MEEQLLFPIKVVFPRDVDYKSRKYKPRLFEPFCSVTDELREKFAGQVQQVYDHFALFFREWEGVPAVAKVTLKMEALAKTYRPTDLFNQTTCPVIGSSGLGELYVSVTPDGLHKVTDRMRNGLSKQTVAHISTLEKIEPYSASDATGAVPPKELYSRSKGRGKDSLLQCRLFRHRSPELNTAVDGAFEKLMEENGIRDKELIDYAEGVRIFSLRNVPPEKLPILEAFKGIQTLRPFPEYRIVDAKANAFGSVTAVNFPPPDPQREYGLVGIIDSGTDPNNSHLQAWVAHRYDYVPRDQQDNDHGSFVAGLIVHGKRLNAENPLFPAASSRIVDVVAIGKDGSISEQALLAVIDDSIRRFPHAKVWNLSLGQEGAPCCDQEVSLLGAALDERIKRHGIQFVCAAGNYRSPPFRTWPPQPGIGEADRICPPADSALSITVGSIAHLDNATSCVRRDHPSPFSRRGPGAAYWPKPELSFPGGNCDPTGQHTQIGVVSVDGSGNIAENIGTSFATPLASSLIAGVFQELDTGTGEQVSPVLVKALTMHAAFVRNGALDIDRTPYYGAGHVLTLDEIVYCLQSSATMIIQVPVRRRVAFVKDPFPMPSCLVVPEVGLQCEIFMTLAYHPPLSGQDGTEYCRTNVNALLGTVSTNNKEVLECHREVPSTPMGLSEGYEVEMVKYGYKWSPMKLYYRRFTKGPWNKPWRLTLTRIDRHEHTASEPQDVTLIITIRTTNRSATVYGEWVSAMNYLGWGALDLQLRSRPRLRP